MKKSIKYLSFFILFTVLTKSYVVWASKLHVSVGMITGSIFFISIFILLLQSKNLKFTVPKRWFKPLVYFTVVAPILVSLLTFSVNVNALLLQFFYVVIFLLAYIFYKENGNKVMFFLFLYSLLFTIVFGFISMVQPSFFTQYGEIISTLSFYGGRAFGFYMQPNSLAFAINLMYIGIIALAPKEKYILYLYPLVTIVLLATGSRSNFIGFAIISLFLFLFLVKKYKMLMLKVLMWLIPIGLILFIFTFGYISKIFQDSQYDDLLARVDTMLLQDEDALSKDIASGSMSGRLQYQEKYISSILGSPLIGYGFGTQNDLRESGELEGAAHNAIYEILLQGGIVYFFFFMYFIVTIIRNYFYIRKVNSKKKKFVLLAYKVFLLYIIYYLFLTTTLFSERLLYILLAVFAIIPMQKKYDKKEME